MKRALVLVVALAGLAGVAAVAPGCSTMNTAADWFRSGNTLSYEKYLSIDPKASPTPTADSVLATLGMPRTVHDRDGVRRRIDYNAYAMTGELKTAEFHFDENEKLTKKELW